jgi:hypothetical protein
MNICPNCESDAEYERIAKHWSYSSSHRPAISKKQHEIITGLVMGDACIDKPGENAYLLISMINREYLEYLDSIFGVFSRGIKKEYTQEEAAKNSIVSNADKNNYNDVYKLTTTTHPELNQYRNWYGNNGKRWDVEKLTPYTLTHFYVCDGTLTGQNQIVISMSSQIERRDYVNSLFTEAGLPSPSNWNIYDRKKYGGKHCQAQWTQQQTKELFDYMNKPLPGFEYKWPK